MRYRRAPTLDPLERLEQVQRVSDTALAHLSVDDLLDELLNRVREILDTDTAAVLLLDEARNELVARAAKGIEEEVERGVRIPVGKGFAGRIAAERKPVALHRVDHSTVLNPILFQKGIQLPPRRAAARARRGGRRDARGDEDTPALHAR